MEFNYTSQPKTLEEMRQATIVGLSPEEVKSKQDFWNYQDANPNGQYAQDGFAYERNKGVIQAGQLADTFKANSDKMGNDIYSNLAQKERQRLAGDLTGIKRTSNSRGLLNSGIREGQEANAKVQSANNVAGYKRSVNDMMQSKQTELNTNAINGDLSAAQAMGSIQDQIYSQALSNMQAQRAGEQALWGAAGSAAGGYLGSQAGTPATAAAPTYGGTSPYGLSNYSSGNYKY